MNLCHNHILNRSNDTVISFMKTRFKYNKEPLEELLLLVLNKQKAVVLVRCYLASITSSIMGCFLEMSDLNYFLIFFFFALCLVKPQLLHCHFNNHCIRSFLGKYIKQFDFVFISMKPDNERMDNKNHRYV